MFRLAFERTTFPKENKEPLLKFTLTPVDEATGREGTHFEYEGQVYQELKALSKALTGVDFVTAHLFERSTVASFTSRGGREHKYCFTWNHAINLKEDCIKDISRELASRITQITSWASNLPGVDYFELDVYPIPPR